LLQINATGLGVVCLRYDRDHVEASVVDLDGTIRWRQTSVAPKSASGLLAALPKSLEAALKATPINRKYLLGVGVADPGLVDRQRGLALRATIIPDWNSVPIKQTLQAVTRLPISLERSDGLQALGEAAFGAGVGAGSVLFVSLVDEGVGGGLVENRHLFAGRHGGAGEIGHVNVLPNGPTCNCGLKGCLEAVASPHRLLEEYNQKSSHRIATFREFLERAHGGDAACTRILSNAASVIARALGSTINLLNPDCIVLGGYFVEAGGLLLQPIQKSLPQYTIPELLDGVQLRLAQHGLDAAYMGVVASTVERYFALPGAATPR
jgi:predicted NBD/HSP70 family sugar kinase